MRKIYKILKTIALVIDIINDEKICAPLLVNRDNKILDGHTRLRLAKWVGLKEIPIVRIDVPVEYVHPDELEETY